jgi:hypothetical protein
VPWSHRLTKGVGRPDQRRGYGARAELGRTAVADGRQSGPGGVPARLVGRRLPGLPVSVSPDRGAAVFWAPACDAEHPEHPDRHTQVPKPGHSDSQRDTKHRRVGQEHDSGRRGHHEYQETEDQARRPRRQLKARHQPSPCRSSVHRITVSRASTLPRARDGGGAHCYHMRTTGSIEV